MTTLIPIPQQLDGDPSPIPPAPIVDDMVTNDGWFPDIDAAALRRQYRIRDAVTPERLREEILGAMITVAGELRVWKAQQSAAQLVSVSSEQLGGENRLAVLYRRAIGAETRAVLLERQRDMDLTAAGQRQVADLDPAIGELRRDRLNAVHDIMGAARATIELL